MIGQAINRVDGPFKVTGQATYAYEHWEAGQPLYGFILGATIGRGRITRNRHVAGGGLARRADGDYAIAMRRLKARPTRPSPRSTGVHSRC